jgi:sialic acid synthase SpsE
MTLIIAEAGVNHNGNEELAFKLVDAAYDAGADIVKFQKFKASKLVTVTTKRPSSGQNPIKYWEMLGNEAINDYQMGDLINE